MTLKSKFGVHSYTFIFCMASDNVDSELKNNFLKLSNRGIESEFSSHNVMRVQAIKLWWHWKKYVAFMFKEC